MDDLIRGLILLAESGEHLPVNIGNPREMTLLELAEAVIRGDRLEERDRASRRCRWTTRRCASPTSRARAQLLGWEPEIELEDGLRRLLASLGREAVVA